MKKILFIAGTRPEAIKLAPVYLQMKRRLALEAVLCSTGQHADLIDHGFSPFGISPDVTLNTMQAGQPLHQLSGHLFQKIGDTIRDFQPDFVIVQGDTVSAFAGGWAAFYQKVPVVHVEAGLRTGNLDHPFPEEAIRRALSVISNVHMAPTAEARTNLVNENVSPDTVFIVGNTTVDALYFMLAACPAEDARHRSSNRHILVTGHRRESLGKGLENVCHALLQLVQAFPDIEITYAIHPNPAVGEPVRRILGSEPRIHLVPPLDYQQFIQAMSRSYFIISDSGGVQEEAPALGRPVLVTRETTERPEAISCGANKLVGTDTAIIVRAATELLTHPEIYDRMATAGCPYGDGKASQRICDYLEGKPVTQFAAD